MNRKLKPGDWVVRNVDSPGYMNRLYIHIYSYADSPYEEGYTLFYGDNRSIGVSVWFPNELTFLRGAQLNLEI